MKVYTEKRALQSRKVRELINVTPAVREVVAASGVRNGQVTVLTQHITSGITVNEGLPDVERDILALLDRIAPEQGDYYHSRYLPADGRLGLNPHCHVQSSLLGMHTHLAVANGELLIGVRQNIYFAELDGPLAREYVIQVMGE